MPLLTTDASKLVRMHAMASGEPNLESGTIVLPVGNPNNPNPRCIYIPATDDHHGPLDKAPLLAVELPEDIDPREFQAVLENCWVLWISQSGVGEVPDPRVISNRTGVELSRVRLLMNTPEFILAAKTRGISPGKMPGLSRRQVAALEILTDPSIKGGLASRLRRAQVTAGEYRAWKKQMAFRVEFDRLTSNIVRDFEADMMTTLAQQGADGDLNAIKYSFELTGRYNPRQEEAANIGVVLAKVLEAIMLTVKDPETLQALGARMNVIALESGSAGMLHQQPLLIEEN